jgi:hypothetical protein
MTVGLERRPSTGLSAQAGRWATIGFHRAKASLFSWSWWGRTGLFLILFCVLGYPAYQKSLGLGLLHTALSVMAVLGKAYVYSTDRSMKIVRARYLERKLWLYRLIKALQRTPEMTLAELQSFQRDTLCLIASYVRSHRADLWATQIYVNLLIESGDELVVIARDSEHRHPGARYPRTVMAASAVFSSGAHLVVGNVHTQYGDVEKPYKSILLLPVRGPSSIIAVVSIDSAKAHHFDLEGDELERYLAPYLALLEWSVIMWHRVSKEF